MNETNLEFNKIDLLLEVIFFKNNNNFMDYDLF
jgi:hypothetical protein